jgi:nitrite reductase/ring-hydroxylating ferredoxin subunit/uncharacterized membrane protein
MSTVPPVEVIERQDWLEPVENGLQRTVAAAYESAGPAGRTIRNFLHGVWLGHPLHPALTDVPLGSWSATLVLDMLEASGARDCAKGADVSLKVGLAGAVAAALAGLTDWQATDGAARRLGVTHGLLNLTVTTLYAASLWQRNRRNRETGRLLAYAGFAISSVSAWLGGNLVYGKRIGVNHATGEGLPAEWTPVLDTADLREGEPRRAEVNGAKILLLRRGGEIYAIEEICSHLGGPLAEGKLEGDIIECPWHGSQFCVRDGSVVNGPATRPQPTLETRLREGRIEVRVRSKE